MAGRKVYRPACPWRVRTRTAARAPMEKYLSDLLQWYRGEIGGEAFFVALANSNGDDPARTAQWLRLAQLERYIGERLRSTLEARAVAIPPSAADLKRGADSAQHYVG